MTSTHPNLNDFVNAHDPGAGRSGTSWPPQWTGGPKQPTPPRPAPPEAADALLQLLGQLNRLDTDPPCSADPELWTGDSLTADQREAAIHQCLACPVLDACRRYADTVDPLVGIWGGQAYGSTRRLKGATSKVTDEDLTGTTDPRAA